jgi:hypothetical protein
MLADACKKIDCHLRHGINGSCHPKTCHIVRKYNEKREHPLANLQPPFDLFRGLGKPKNYNQIVTT